MSDEDLRREERLARAGVFGRRRLAEVQNLATALSAIVERHRILHELELTARRTESAAAGLTPSQLTEQYRRIEEIRMELGATAVAVPSALEHDLAGIFSGGAFARCCARDFTSVVEVTFEAFSIAPIARADFIFDEIVADYTRRRRRRTWRVCERHALEIRGWITPRRDSTTGINAPPIFPPLGIPVSVSFEFPHWLRNAATLARPRP